MTRLVLVTVLYSVLCVLTLSGAALADRSAASDPLEGLNDVEKAYVNRMKGAFSAASSSLDKTVRRHQWGSAGRNLRGWYPRACRDDEHGADVQGWFVRCRSGIS